MKALPHLRARLLSTYFATVLVAINMFIACSSSTGREAKVSVMACAKAEENKLVDQATKALLDTMGQDPRSVMAFLDALVLDAAQAGIGDAVSFVTCVAEATRAKLIEWATHASIDPERYTQTLQAIDSWESAHPRSL